MSLQGKNAMITGSSRGIGRGIALALAREGCNVAISYFRKRGEAEQAAADVAALGVRSVVLRANLARTEDAERLVRSVGRELGGVDIFVSNAASGVFKPAAEINRKDWDWTMGVNARSFLAGVQTALPHMQSQGWGRVITITSGGSRRVVPNYSVIGASKAALESLSRYLAVELAPHGIVVNCISPGLVETDALDYFPNRDSMVARVRQRTPSGRLVTPGDVGNVVVWLCSEQAAMIVGQTIELDGGYTLAGLI
jgi:enoyl-[acyl-carrier protein] reductase III